MKSLIDGLAWAKGLESEDGVATVVDVKEVKVSVDPDDVDHADIDKVEDTETLSHDEVKELVAVNDGLSASDVSTSVESYFGSQVPFLPKFKGVLDSHVSVEAETSDKPNLMKSIVAKIVEFIKKIGVWFTDIKRKIKGKMEKVNETVALLKVDSKEVTLTAIDMQLFVKDGAISSNHFKSVSTELVKHYNGVKEQAKKLYGSSANQFGSVNKTTEELYNNFYSYISELSQGESGSVTLDDTTKVEFKKILQIFDSMFDLIVDQKSIEPLQTKILDRLEYEFPDDHPENGKVFASEVHRFFELYKHFTSLYSKVIFGGLSGVEKIVGKDKSSNESYGVEAYEAGLISGDEGGKIIEAFGVDPISNSPKRFVISGYNAQTNPAAEAGDNLLQTTILMQNGVISEVGVNGVTAEDLLKVVEENYVCFQEGKFACEENEEVLFHLRAAQAAIQKRFNRRSAEGTEGTYQGN